MTLVKLKSAPLLLLEDCFDGNILPLLLEVIQHEKNSILHFFSYEQPVDNWKNVFKDKSNIVYHEYFDPDFHVKYADGKYSIVIDSTNQMSLRLGWNICLKNIVKLTQNPNITQIVLIFHKDCLLHLNKLQTHLNHIANAIVSYDDKNPYKIKVHLKKNGKVFQSEEILSYDMKSQTLRSTPVLKEEKRDEEPVKSLPANLSTFKIEVEQTEKLEKYKLKLPYMSKINEGESKVYYEPDAVDDWDEEDPDEDLDI